MRFSIILLVLFNYYSASSQATVGVLSSSEDVSEGYTFFSPFSGTKAYLVDNCGNLVNSWDRGTKPGLAAYFLDSGMLFRTYKVDPVGPFTSASNAGGIELVNWDNETVWHYEINTSEQLSHHDAVMLPNGNVLILTWELTYEDELIAMGRDPNEIAPQQFMWSEKILELEPIGSDDAKIVWEWHINDHYIQDFDDSKADFGVVSDHPELFDINLPDLNSSNSNATRDWNHFNSIDYHSDLDQILLSVRNSDEIWILDHTTTTEEAASHSGGQYGRGGDILYRWGNGSAYKAVDPDKQMLWGQHGVHWIGEGLQDEGSIQIYNNGNGKPGGDFSQVQLIDPPQDSLGYYSQGTSMPFGPETAQTTYGDLPEEEFYSPYLSNAQRLTNGNTLINVGSRGRIFEVTETREVVWEYEIPLIGDSPAVQGQNVSSNSTFRAYKFDPDFIGFEGLDLSAGEPIEINPLDCERFTSTSDLESSDQRISYNPARNLLKVYGDYEKIKLLQLITVQGHSVFETQSPEEEVVLPVQLVPGVYFVHILNYDGTHRTIKIMV